MVFALITNRTRSCILDYGEVISLKTFEARIHEQDKEKSFTLIGLVGFLDAHTLGDFEKTVDDCLNEGWKNIILDLSGLKYISSAGIGSLMQLTRRIEKEGNDFVLLKPTEKVLDIFGILGFNTIFNIVQSKDEAIKNLKPIPTE